MLSTRRLIRCVAIATIRCGVYACCKPPQIAVTTMASPDKKSRAVVLPLILFLLTILPAIGLLIAALTIWLSYLFNSAIWACVVVGAGFLLIAIIVYLVSLRGAVKRVQERMETIYETSRAVQSGFEWVNEKIVKLWS